MQIKRTTFCSLAGFTLLELIVAIALMDVIAVSLYASMHIAFTVRQSAHAAMKPYQSITPIFEIIRRDLTSAMQPDGILAGVFVGDNVPFGSGLNADTLSFYSAAYQPKENEIASNVLLVQYGLQDDRDRDLVVLKRFTTRTLLAATPVAPHEEVIGRNIAGFDLQYYDGDTWLDTWDSSQQDSTLPRGVRVTISILDENRGRFSKNRDPYRHFTRIFLLPFANQESETVSEEQS